MILSSLLDRRMLLVALLGLPLVAYAANEFRLLATLEGAGPAPGSQNGSSDATAPLNRWVARPELQQAILFPSSSPPEVRPTEAYSALMDTVRKRAIYLEKVESYLSGEQSELARSTNRLNELLSRLPDVGPDELPALDKLIREACENCRSREAVKKALDALTARKLTLDLKGLEARCTERERAYRKVVKAPTAADLAIEVEQIDELLRLIRASDSQIAKKDAESWERRRSLLKFAADKLTQVTERGAETKPDDFVPAVHQRLDNVEPESLELLSNVVLAYAAKYLAPGKFQIEYEQNVQLKGAEGNVRQFPRQHIKVYPKDNGKVRRLDADPSADGAYTEFELKADNTANKITAVEPAKTATG